MWDDQRRDGGTNSTLRIKEQEKCLTLNEHDDDDDDITLVWTCTKNGRKYNSQKSIIYEFGKNKNER